MGKSGKLIGVVFALVVSFSVQAEQLGLQFRGAKLGEVIEGVVKGVLDRDYVLAGDLPSLQSSVTLNVKGVEKSKVLEVLRSVTASYGVDIVERNSILYVERIGAVDRQPEPGKAEQPMSVWGNVPGLPRGFGMVDRSGYEPRAYFPKYRSVEFLSMAVQAAGGIVAGSAQGQGGVFGGMPSQGVQQNIKRDALVYSASPELVKKIEVLVDQLDIPMMAVQLKAAVLEVSDSSEKVRSLSGVLELLGGRLGISLGAGVASVGNAATIRTANLQAVLSAVDGDSRFKFLSEPSLRVLDGEKARLVVGSDVPVRGAVTVDKNGNSIQSIDYKTSGLVLEVQPIVLQGAVQLRINQQISSFTTTTTSGIDSPTLLKRETDTVVQASDGELIALAGLDENRESGTSSGLAFLPAWMNSRSANNSRSQVLILLEVKKVPVASI